MKRIEYPYHIAAKLVVQGDDSVNQLISDTKKIHTAYLDCMYDIGTLQKRINELEQENKFLLKTINEMSEHNET